MLYDRPFPGSEAQTMKRRRKPKEDTTYMENDSLPLPQSYDAQQSVDGRVTVVHQRTRDSAWKLKLSQERPGYEAQAGD